LDDLRRGRRRFEPEALAGDALELRVGRRVCPDRPAELSDPHALERARHASPAAVELEGPPRKLEAEGRRLGVHAVRAAHLERQTVLLGACYDRREGAIEAFEHEPAGLADL